MLLWWLLALLWKFSFLPLSLHEVGPVKVPHYPSLYSYPNWAYLAEISSTAFGHNNLYFTVAEKHLIPKDLFANSKSSTLQTFFKSKSITFRVIRLIDEKLMLQEHEGLTRCKLFHFTAFLWASPVNLSLFPRSFSSSSHSMFPHLLI